MANDLVRWDGWKDGRGQSEENEAADGWDRPPSDDPAVSAPTLRRHDAAIRKADRDAGAARGRGDGSFEVQREEDSREHRQARWDWGDARTWLLIGAMCVGFLLISLWIYVMPFGRHNQNDGPSSTPTAKYY